MPVPGAERAMNARFWTASMRMAGSSRTQRPGNSTEAIFGQIGAEKLVRCDQMKVELLYIAECPNYREAARVLRETEEVLLEAARHRQFPAVVLRVAGIYGPERGYWLKQYLGGEARIEGQGERALNMIHRDDVAGVIIAALERGRPGEIYNAVDDEPVSQLDFFRWLSGRLGKEMPPFVEETEAGRKRGVTNKRVSNRKLRDELGYQFKYPTFREGTVEELKSYKG